MNDIANEFRKALDGVSATLQKESAKPDSEISISNIKLAADDIANVFSGAVVHAMLELVQKTQVSDKVINEFADGFCTALNEKSKNNMESVKKYSEAVQDLTVRKFIAKDVQYKERSDYYIVLNDGQKVIKWGGSGRFPDILRDIFRDDGFKSKGEADATPKSIMDSHGIVIGEISDGNRFATYTHKNFVDTFGEEAIKEVELKGTLSMADQ